MSEECTEILNASCSVTPRKNNYDYGVTHGHSQWLSPLSFYLHIIHNAYVDKYGHAHTGNLDIIPAQCRIKVLAAFDAKTLSLKWSFHQEVFTIAQNWGNGYFHGLIENLPRIVSYLDFLQSNPEIKVHVASKFIKPHLLILGISSTRVITGRVKADIVYLPQSGGCGGSHTVAVQGLQQAFMQHIPLQYPRLTRNSIVVIRRSHKRWLHQHQDVMAMIQHLSAEYEMNVKEFRDDPPPTLIETMAIFSSAKLVVGPHGAGFANLIYAKPGTYVIKILCSPFYDGKAPQGCYKSLSHHLGMHYVRLVSNYVGPCGKISIDIKYLWMLIKHILVCLKNNDVIFPFMYI